jgi:hypothetical protein
MKMKTLIIIVINLNTFSVCSQGLLNMDFDYSNISFEDTAEYKFVKQDTSDIWQIVEPNKQILFIPTIHAYLGKFAIISDTNTYYANNINAWFQFKLLFGEGDSYYITYSQKYDFEENKDGGIIETSYDNGITWQNILFDPLIQSNLEAVQNFYSPEDTINAFQNQPGFTGLQSEIEMVYITFEALDSTRGKTMLLRFSIGTDSVNAQNEGWMLDDFRFGGILKDNIESYKNNGTSIDAYPNPSNEIITVYSYNESIKKLEIISFTGEILLEKLNTNSIEITDRLNGVYLLRINDRYIKKLFIK